MSKPIIIYDIQVLPELGGSESSDYAMMQKLYNQDKIIFWDSTKGTPGVNCEPKVIISEDDTDIPLKIKDVAGVVPDRIISTEEEVPDFKIYPETSPQQIEDYIYSILHRKITPGNPKRTAVFTIGEYGAVLFHRAISQGIVAKNYIIKDNSFRGMGNERDPEPQFVIYEIPNGMKIKLLISDYGMNRVDPISGEVIDQNTGYPVDSTILKFKEII